MRTLEFSEPSVKAKRPRRSKIARSERGLILNLSDGSVSYTAPDARRRLGLRAGEIHWTLWRNADELAGRA
jgi:hypothetical protein